MEEFVCESMRSTPSEHLALNLAAVISRGKINGRALIKAQKLAAKISASISLPELIDCGLTEKESAIISACICIGQELCSSPFKLGERFSNSRDLFNRYRARFFNVRKEYFLSLILNSKNQLIKEVLISIGSLSTSVVHPREVFAPAIRESGAAIIFLHNHPSGDPAPSGEDRDCTQRLCQVGKLIGIRCLDHIVVGFEDYFSFADAGLMQEST